jgi:hypothetical protein
MPTRIQGCVGSIKGAPGWRPSAASLTKVRASATVNNGSRCGAAREEEFCEWPGLHAAGLEIYNVLEARRVLLQRLMRTRAKQNPKAPHPG